MRMSIKRTALFFILLLISGNFNLGKSFEPEFTEPLINMTVTAGRDAVFRCFVRQLGGYRVGWVKSDTKAIQAIHDHVITHNPRISVSHVDHTMWNLHLHSVKEEDAGQYMCQINTDPMKSQIGILKIVVPPEFIPEETSGDVLVQEGSSLRLTCKAKAHPEAHIYWRREDETVIIIREITGHRNEVSIYNGETLYIPKVTRIEMGVYLCIASNGIPPGISKRVTVNVHFHPFVQVPNQLVGAPLGTDVLLECFIEAFPIPITIWKKEEGTPQNLSGRMVMSDAKHEIDAIQKLPYMLHMVMVIKRLRKKDMGSYHCIAKNSLGSVESNIRLYEISGPTHLNTISIGEEEDDYEDQFEYEEREYDEELYNNVIQKGKRPSIRLTARPPVATYDSASANDVVKSRASNEKVPIIPITYTALLLLAFLSFVL